MAYIGLNCIKESKLNKKLSNAINRGLTNNQLVRALEHIVVALRSPKLWETLIKIKVLKDYNHNARVLCSSDIKTLVERLKFFTGDEMAAKGMLNDGVMYAILTEIATLLPHRICDYMVLNKILEKSI